MCPHGRERASPPLLAWRSYKFHHQHLILQRIKRGSTHLSSRAACHRYLLSGRCRLFLFGIVSWSFYHLITKRNVAGSFKLLFYDSRKLSVYSFPDKCFQSPCGFMIFLSCSYFINTNVKLNITRCIFLIMP